MSISRNRRNYYRILHVQPDAPGAVLKSSYRALMRSLEMHPDRGGEHWNAALINEAYGVLSDPARRVEYDRTLDIARIRNGRSSGRATTEPRRRHTPAEPPAADVSEERTCLFCGAARTFGGPPPVTAVCLECRSPLTVAGAPEHEASGKRAAHRVARTGNLRYYACWPQPRPHEGRLVDLSPGGLRFETKAPLEVLHIIKLEGPLLDAVARVVTCRELGGASTVGVQFFTVRFHHPAGRSSRRAPDLAPPLVADLSLTAMLPGHMHAP